jgi:S1-C subfamily serine protease
MSRFKGAGKFNRMTMRMFLRRGLMVATFTATTLAIVIVPASAQVTSNVLRRTRLIRISEEEGTAFTIEVDRRQYLVTAKHVVKALPDGQYGKIEVLTTSGWSALSVEVFKCDDPVDIAVLVPPAQLTVNYALEPSLTGVELGQDVYFVGFPYGITKTYASLPGVFGLVKRATLP